MIYKFGPIKVLFKDFPKSSLWPFSIWKLDSFKIDDDATPDIIINYFERYIEPKGKAIWEEDSTNVCRQIFALEGGEILWQQLEKSTGDLQLQLLMASNRREITLTCDNSQTVGMGAFEALTFVIFYAFLHQNVLTFHGALVEENGKGFLLCADSGVGKTTHARLWRDIKNALIINGDKASCFLKNDKWYGFGTPWCGTSGEYINRSVPLQAVVILERGTQNRVYEEKPIALLSHVVVPSWDRKTTELMLSLLDAFLGKIPILRLECTPDATAVEVLYNALESLQ